MDGEGPSMGRLAALPELSDVGPDDVTGEVVKLVVLLQHGGVLHG